MRSRRLLAIGLGAALAAPVAAPSPVGGAPTRVSVESVAWLQSQQQPDGGFELLGVPGFETADAILGLAASVHEGVWDVGDARAAILALKKGSADPLTAIDALVDDVEDPSTDAAGAQAAKVVALVAGPLELDPADFDPANNSAEPVDLIARMDLHRDESGAYDFGAQFNGALYAALALDAIDEEIPSGLIAQIVEAQRSDGSWNYAGDQDPDTAGDIDTTSLALLSLAAAQLGTSDATVLAGVSYLASGQQANGAWQFFGADDPNSTAMASIALSGLKLDVTDPSWGQRFGAAVPSTASPYAWLHSQENAEGRVLSPNDEYGINTLATSQTLQATGNQWHLRQERRALLLALSDILAQPGMIADPTRAADLVLGGNPSDLSARTAAAHTVAMSESGRIAAAEELFQRAFQRPLDQAGRAFWSAELEHDARSRVLARLTGSPEFYERSGGTTASFVENAYQVVLGRGPDNAGRAYWEARLDDGAPVSSIALDLVSSYEYRANEVDLAYQKMLGRDSDAAGRQFWADRLKLTRVEAILAGIGGSAEFYELHI
ncbi:MAG: DUF4214 domain-containing protein [Acidimicrobiales bacterium]|nr:DUF4214 domain-containing protein [Acidimicrobiales bacterium]